MNLPGATVEVLESGYAVIRWQGYSAICPLNEGEFAVFAELEKVRLNVAAAEQRASERTRASRESILARRTKPAALSAASGR
jgi:hypothetical protein